MYLIRFILLICLFPSFSKAQIIFSEVNYHSDTTREAGDWVELYNKSNSAVDLSNWKFTDSQTIHYFNINPGTVLAPGAYLVLVQDTALFRDQHPSVMNYQGPFTFGLSGSSELIRIFNSSGVVQFSMTYMDTLAWPKAADGYGRTLEIKDVNGNQNDGNNWYAGCIGGSPGTAHIACNDQVVVSEINYNSDSLYDSGDWIELRNLTNQPVNLSGWVIADKGDSAQFTIPSGTVIAANGHLVFASDLSKFNSIHNGVPATGPFLFNLRNKGDAIKIYGPDGIIYSMLYDNKAPWPAGPDGQGWTLEINDPAGDPNVGTNWFAGCITGSPGTTYSTPCLINGLGENDPQLNVTVFPNPLRNGETKISLSQEIKTYNISDIAGRCIQNGTLDGTSIMINSQLSSGIYYISAETRNGRIIRLPLMVE